MRRTLLVVVALAGCKHHLEWNPKVATKLVAGPFSLEIPAGWRDLNESTDPMLAHMARQADATAHIIVREDAANTDSNVAFMWTEVARPITCAQFVAALEQMHDTGIDPRTTSWTKIGADEICKLHQTQKDSVGVTYIRMHGSGYATLSCLHAESGDADNDAVCEALHTALVAQ